jgi:tRNA U34 5-methylaminomethyl-2-thiouridine-forming methyltransferase MnmC
LNPSLNPENDNFFLNCESASRNHKEHQPKQFINKMRQAQDFTPQVTADGSFTFFSTEFGETYHSMNGARQTAELRFVQPAILPRMVHQPTFRLLDIGYGLGYNTAAALEWIWSIKPNCRVELIALELDVAVSQAAIAHNLLNLWVQPVQNHLTMLAEQTQLQTQFLEAQLKLGDARQTIRSLPSASFDAIFLDPFSPAVCPQLWTIEFLALVACCLKPMGRLATYSDAAAVRTALIANGLHIGSTQMIGQRSVGTVASPTNLALPPLTIQEQNQLQTWTAVPYRDLTRTDGAATILQRHQQE